MPDGTTPTSPGGGAARWAMVLAAGGGTRFGAEKQFVRAAGHRLVDLAVDAVAAVCDHVVVVLPPGRAWDGRPVHATVAGGSDRPSSVQRGLAAIPDTEGTVIVHQAANPLAGGALLRTLLAAIDAGAAAAVPGLRPADLVRRTTDGRLGEVVGRDDLVLVQTPAAFRLPVLRAAHQQQLEALEDTALVSALGHDVVVVPGDPRNVHVASPEDLELVAALLAHRLS
jgi:2-C-methyl-D-erythritol 4-phosphate cytidylyltransferase